MCVVYTGDTRPVLSDVHHPTRVQKPGGAAADAADGGGAPRRPRGRERGQRVGARRYADWPGRRGNRRVLIFSFVVFDHFS